MSAAKTKKVGPQIKITLVKSKIGCIPKHMKTIAALGLNKTNSSTIKTDNVAIRGMINKISHMVKVEEIK